MGTFSGRVLPVPVSDTGTWSILVCPCNIESDADYWRFEFKNFRNMGILLQNV